MGRLSTCPVCGKSVSPSQPYKEFKNKKYHIECYRRMQQQAFSTTYEKEVVKKSEKDDLYDYIRQIFKTEEIDGLILKQIDNYSTEYNLDYEQIHSILYYFFTIKQNSTDNIRGIGILPYVTSEANEFYKMKREAHRLLKDKEVKIDTQIITVSKKKSNLPPLIDITNL